MSAGKDMDYLVAKARGDRWSSERGGWESLDGTSHGPGCKTYSSVEDAYAWQLLRELQVDGYSWELTTVFGGHRCTIWKHKAGQWNPPLIEAEGDTPRLAICRAYLLLKLGE